MTFPTTTSDDSNLDSFGTSCNNDGARESSAPSWREGDEFDGEGSTCPSASHDVPTEDSTIERLETVDAIDSLDSRDGSFNIAETDVLRRESSDIRIVATSEESAEYGDKSTVISSEARKKSADASKSDEAKNGSEDVDVLKPGERFGQFTVVRFVGGGGMGRVYEGVDNELERKVAIKVLPKRRAQDEAVVARFLNEAKSAARLNHENIAQVYLSGNVDGTPYIAFEYVDGTNLRDYVRDRGVLELNEAIDFVLQAADALAHAALHGVTHRDVKPSNIIITPQKRAKLIDMGLARLLKNDADDDLTESGVTLGTFDYISPEQARDPRLADVRSDVYSLGCTFYYMLVGEPPFPEGTMLQKLLQHQGDEAPDVREANPKTPVEIASVVKKMMRKNPDERYQTPEALIADLKEISELLGIRVSNADFVEKGGNEKAPSIRWKRFLPGLFSSILLLAFVAVYHFSAKPKMTLPEIDVSWNGSGALQKPQDKSDSNEPGENETNDAAQRDSRASLASNDPTSGVVSSEKKNVWETNLGNGKVGDGADLDVLYATVYKTSLGTEYDLAQENSFSSESESSVASRRAAFYWKALGEDRSATVTLCPNFSTDSETSVVRSCSLSALGARNVKNAIQESSNDSNLFIVDGIGAAPNSFATLRAALEASASLDVGTTARVELRFNGSISVASTTLDGQKIEICAGEGFRPSLSYQPAESTNDAQVERFLRSISSNLLIDGVSMTFVVPKRQVGAKFAFFETSGASSLTIRNSNLTFVVLSDSSTNVSSSGFASFFSLTNGEKNEGEQGLTGVDDTDEKIGSTVRLENVFARGEAVLANIEQTNARIEAESCLFNLSSAFFRYVASKSDAPDQPSFSVKCSRVLAFCGSYFAQIDAENSKSFLPFFDVSLVNSIVRLPSRPFAFVSSATPLPEETFWNEWNFKSTSLLDALTFCRCNLARDGSFKDYPSPYEKVVCETISLNGSVRDANKRSDDSAPSSLALSEFASYVLTSLEESTDILLTTRENVKFFKELVATLEARFPEDLTKK